MVRVFLDFSFFIEFFFADISLCSTLFFLQIVSSVFFSSKRQNYRTGIKIKVIYIDQPFSIMVRVFANGLGDRDSIPGWHIPKTQKMIFDTYLLITQHYKVRIKDKCSNSGKGVSQFPTYQYCSY